MELHAALHEHARYTCIHTNTAQAAAEPEHELQLCVDLLKPTFNAF